MIIGKQVEEIKTELVRASVYVDGFNLYYSLKSKGWSRYYWLDIYGFGKSLIQDRHLASVKYFTADISGNPRKARRQQTFLNALKSHSPLLKTIKGKFLQKKITCRSCSSEYDRYEEKMTDVNIATHLVNDAWKDEFDVAIIVSGDSDLIPPITTVKEEFPDKNVIVAFPPQRCSHHFEQKASTFFIGKHCFSRCQMPDVVVKADGTELHRPPRWR